MGGIKHSIELLIAIFAGNIRENIKHLTLRTAWNGIEPHGVSPAKRAPDIGLKTIHCRAAIRCVDRRNGSGCGEIVQISTTAVLDQCDGRPNNEEVDREHDYYAAFHNFTHTLVLDSEQTVELRLSFAGV